MIQISYELKEKYKEFDLFPYLNKYQIVLITNEQSRLEENFPNRVSHVMRGPFIRLLSMLTLIRIKHPRMQEKDNREKIDSNS